MKFTTKRIIVVLAFLLSLFFVLSYDGVTKNEDNLIEKKTTNAGTIDLGMNQLPVANTEKKLVVKDVMKPSSEQLESHEDVEVGENIGDDIFLPPLVGSSSDSSTETEQIKLNVKEEPRKHLNFKEMLEQQDRELMKSYNKINSSKMDINVKRNVELPKKSDKVVLRNDLLPEQPKISQDEIIDDSLTYLVIIKGEARTLSSKEYRAYLNTPNSNQQVKHQTEDYSLDSGVDDFLNNIKPEPIKPKVKSQSDDEIPSLEALMD